MKNQHVIQTFEELEIQRCIVPLRGVQVILDRDLAAMYGVEVKQLNRQVKRNIERFPSDFMFQLTKDDCSRCQIGTLNEGRGSNVKYLPYAFTENGVAMLSGVLRSSTAIEVNIRIMRAFVAMRRFVSDHAGLVQRVGAIERRQLETDKRIDTVFNKQYKDLAVTYTDDFHDRFLIIDNAELFGLGSSINSLGRRVTSYTTRDANEIAKLLAAIRPAAAAR